MITVIIIWLASVLDYIIGDPWNWVHPVQVMGWIIKKYYLWIFDRFSSPQLRKKAGIILGIGLPLGCAIVSWTMIAFVTEINYFAGIILQVILLASCFAGKSLHQAADDVLGCLLEDQLSQARYRLSFYVGRDTEHLSEKDILRAVLETVAENTVDGVTAPLCYALLGVIFPMIGCVPFAIAYKAVSTLDSMIGYKEEPFTHIGWFSAKLEDKLTWLPCRLTVWTLAILSFQPRRNIEDCKKYAYKDPSPNSGWSEGIFAVILRVQLGGDNTYKGKKKHKPLLGKPEKPIERETIKEALFLTRISFLGILSTATILKALIT